MRPTFRKFWLASLSFAAITLNAQEYRARVQGTVADSTQAAIPGATVILQSATTGVSASRQSDERGHYLFDLVLPGTYTVNVEAKGFNKFSQTNVVLQSRADVTVDVVLKAGDVIETVTVTGQASTVQFNTSKLETTIDQSLVSNLPQIGRNPLMLARLDRPSCNRTPPAKWSRT
jgi:hypothetical protein